MTVRFSAFDAADYLDSPETISAFLNEACASQDHNEIALALGAVARAQGMNELARRVGVSGPGLRKALSGGGNPTMGNLVKIAAALGVQLAFAPAPAKAETATRKVPAEMSSAKARAKPKAVTPKARKAA